ALCADDRRDLLLFAALEDGFCVVEGGLCGSHVCFRLVELRLALRERRPPVGVIQERDDLTCLDPLTFLEDDLDDLARDLGGHGGAASGHHISGGVEQGGAGRGAAGGNALRHGGGDGHARRPHQI